MPQDKDIFEIKLKQKQSQLKNLQKEIAILHHQRMKGTPYLSLRMKNIQIEIYQLQESIQKMISYEKGKSEIMLNIATHVMRPESKV